MEPPRPQNALPVWHGTVAYDGTIYHGWQIQTEATTVQGEITSRLRRLFAIDDLRIAGTSRTDSGVHALDQHFSFPDLAPGRFTAERLAFLLRRWLPEQILLKELRLEAPEFHARHSACGKAYTYVVCCRPRVSPFQIPYVWHVDRELNLDSIRSAAEILVGTHDFSSLAAAREEAENPVRTIHRLEIVADGPYLYFNVVGNSFLYKMVRSIAGYLVLNVGRDARWTPQATVGMLAAAQRNAQVQTAPPQGLFLAKVFFDAEAWRSYTPILPPFAEAP